MQSATAPDHGFLASNVVHFARALRRAGVPVGPDRVLDVLRALQMTGVMRRDDFYWTLAAVLLSRREQFEIFDQAFDLFWRRRSALERIVPDALPDSEKQQQPVSARVAEALGLTRKVAIAAEEAETELDATISASATENLRRQDFESMTTEELNEAKRIIAKLRLPIPLMRTRRLRPNPRGHLTDLRATLRTSLRSGVDSIMLQRRSFQRRHPPLVVLCDISGSMSRYSRMLLHFLHAITNDIDRVHTFVFGTRLTNVTRHLQHRDVDVALDSVSRAVADWSGGTRIGMILKTFNQRWSRRVLGQNAVVLLISDGLDREAGAELSEQMERLHKSTRKLIWLNPLLRFKGFEPRAEGVRLMLPHVDAFMPAHNIESLSGLANALAPRLWQLRSGTG
ncbi:MAG: VWA domain-containing protein [Burkholderiales bacterium]|jgi:uncharacterized protein with von Willebrand factor type A (vWA) domain